MIFCAFVAKFSFCLTVSNPGFQRNRNKIETERKTCFHLKPFHFLFHFLFVYHLHFLISLFLETRQLGQGIKTDFKKFVPISFESIRSRCGVRLGKIVDYPSGK